MAAVVTGCGFPNEGSQEVCMVQLYGACLAFLDYQLLRSLCFPSPQWHCALHYIHKPGSKHMPQVGV